MTIIDAWAWLDGGEALHLGLYKDEIPGPIRWRYEWEMPVIRKMTIGMAEILTEHGRHFMPVRTTTVYPGDTFKLILEMDAKDEY